MALRRQLLKLLSVARIEKMKNDIATPNFLLLGRFSPINLELTEPNTARKVRSSLLSNVRLFFLYVKVSRMQRKSASRP